MRALLQTLALCLALGLAHAEDLRGIAQRVNSAQASWKANTEMAEVEWDRLRRLAGARRVSGQSPLPLKLEAGLSAAGQDLPPEFDARTRWPLCPSIRHVRDQGNCGSCWAVATASAFSDRLCIATEGAFADLLSGEELLACCRTCGFGCEGGYPEVAWLYVHSRGIVTGGGYNSSHGCQPYSLKSCEHHTKGNLPSCTAIPEEKAPKCYSKCTNPGYQNSFENDHHRSSKGYRLNKSVEAIQREILIHGPVEATFTVYTDFATYKSGVYHHVIGKTLGGHAVKLLGWGSEGGEDYWLAANSWNSHWGEDGFFRIRRGVNECGIEADITAALPLLSTTL